MNQVNATQSIGALSNGREAIRIVLATAPTADEGGSWIQLLPVGPDIHARDGRAFKASDLKAIVKATELPLLLDWEHRSEWGDTTAAGWIEELAVEAGASRFRAPGLWGRVDFTPKGRADVESRMYRYVSPVVVVDKASQEALFLAAVALTNRPALSMQAIETLAFSVSKRLASSTPTHAKQVHQFRNVPKGVDIEALRRQGLTDEQIQRAIDYQNEITARRFGETFAARQGSDAEVPERLRVTGLSGVQLAELRSQGLTDEQIFRAWEYNRHVRGEG